MLALFVVLALFAGALADDSHCCSAEDRRELQRLWRGVWSADHTGHRLAIAQAVFADLFEHHPEVKDLFARVKGGDPNSPEFRSHCIRVLQGLDIAINELSDSPVLNAALAHLNTQHKGRDGVKAGHFTAINESFQRVMPQVSTCFNKKAWDHCFHRIADGISAGLAA